MVVLLNGVEGIAWCVNGYLNTIRSIEERSRVNAYRVEDYTHFNQFSDSKFLIDLPLCGRIFMWYRGWPFYQSSRSFFIIGCLSFFLDELYPGGSSLHYF